MPRSSLCRLAVPCLFAAWVASFCPASLVAQDLDAADRGLKHHQEGQVHTAAKRCVDANSPESAELLLEVMDREGRLSRNHFEAGHYRDIVFDYLIKLTDTYAKRRVADEVNKNKKNPFARQWAVEALGHFGGHEFGEFIERGLVDKDAGVRRWAAWSAGKVRYEHAAKKLERVARDRDDYARGNAIEALARIDAAAYGPGFVEGVRSDKSAAVRCALLGAAMELVPATAESLAQAALEDEDWRPRMQAVENLSKTKTKTAVDALIERGLHDNRSLIARKALEGLQTLTGEPISQVDVWPRWWADNRETFQFPEASGEVAERGEGNQTVTFEGIPVDSDHVAFVIDKSYWMQRDAVSKGVTRNEAAYVELEAVLSRLTGEPMFNIYVYDEEVNALSKKMLPLTPANAKRALRFAQSEAKGRSKDMWAALEMVVSDPKIDTVYLLSSGEADVGLYCHGNRIGRHIGDLHRFHKTIIHAIAYTEREGDRWHVEQPAKATGGTFRAVE